MIGWASVALASGLEAYPRCAPVSVPGGTLRIEVPLDLRSVDDPPDGSDLVLVGPGGDPVPFARIEGDPGDLEPVSVRLEPTLDPRVFAVELGPRPVDLLRVHVPPGLVAANVTVRQGDAASGEVLAGPTLVWQLSSSSRSEVPLPGASGRIELGFAPVGDSGFDAPTVEGVRRRGPAGDPDRIQVPVGPPVLQENGFARYDFALPRPLPVDRLEIEAVPDVFSRAASLEASPIDPLGRGLSPELFPSTSATIERVAVGSVRIESATVPGPGVGAERFSLLISYDRTDPLPVTGVVAEVDRAELLVLSAPSGRYTLCGGAPVGTSRGSDLAIATPELVRTASATIVPGEVEENPAYTPPEVRANLTGPGPALDVDRFRWKRAVNGSGLVAVPLPPEVLSVVRPDLGDLRLVAGGGQIPYVLRRQPADPPLEGVSQERTERDGTSRIRLHLPARGLPLARVMLQTDAPAFSRIVTLERPDQGSREILRTVSWESSARPNRLAIEVPGPIDDTLVVAIDNGDDPPLPLSAPVEVRSAGWELLTVLPAGGATLVYGAPSVGPPDYDLSLLTEDLRRRVESPADLGPAEAGGRGRLTLIDRLLLAAGLGVLGLGILGLAADAVRRLPAGDVPPREPA